MASTVSSRLQFVISSGFIGLILLALSLFGGGYYWYIQQQQVLERDRQTRERFKTPPYFVNRGASVMRSCQRCLEAAGKLMAQTGWKVGGPQEIPATEQRWFLAVEDPPIPATVSGVLMLPVHPAFRDNPSLGFDQTRVVLVLYQNLERKSSIEQPAPAQAPVSPPPPADPPEIASAEPADEAQPAETVTGEALFKPKSPFIGNWKNIDPNTKSLTRLVIIRRRSELVVHAWANCRPVECDWGESSGVSLPPEGGSFLIVWDHKYALHRQELSIEDEKLKVSLQTHFTDSSGRHDFVLASFFARSAEIP